MPKTSLVYYQIRIIVMKLLELKLNAKIGRKITQNKLLLISLFILQNSDLSVKCEVLTRGVI